MFVSTHNREQTHLNLRIIKSNQFILWSICDKGWSYLSCDILSGRDILEIRIGTGETTSCCNRLIVACMYPIILTCNLEQSVYVGRLQFRVVSIPNDMLCNRIEFCKFIEDFGIHTKTSFCLLCCWIAEFFKEYFSHLFRRVDIKLNPCKMMNLLFEFSYRLFELHPNPFEDISIDFDTRHLHTRHDFHQGKLYLLQYLWLRNIHIFLLLCVEFPSHIDIFSRIHRSLFEIHFIKTKFLLLRHCLIGYHLIVKLALCKSIQSEISLSWIFDILSQ